MENKIIIIGAGAAGLSAALELAKNQVPCILVSDMPSERAQSVMAEGGINAAWAHPEDSPKLHAQETFQAGRYIADASAVYKMTETAPEIIEALFAAGMNFTLDEDKKPDVRAFGGQSVKRTYYAAANTGKQLMHTLIAQVRRYEAENMVERLNGWLFLKLLCRDGQACGCELMNAITQEKKKFYGKIIIASGGLNGMFGNATGSVKNTGAVSANLFVNGVQFANGEFIQYHPTTVKLHGKNMLITEAVRGEGGRLYTLENDKPYYFMEEKYPKLGNLMPRDVIAKEEYLLMQQGKKIYLDMRHLSKDVCENKLKGVIEDCKHFFGIDPQETPIPVTPGIHYFMGGIWVDKAHRTSVRYLYAAGECACQYHGANRLGGNSLLGALYGGMVAARSAMEDKYSVDAETFDEDRKMTEDILTENVPGGYVRGVVRMQSILQKGLNVFRDEAILRDCISQIENLYEELENTCDMTASEAENRSLAESCLLGKAMLMSADARKESRGAHQRTDYPQENDTYKMQTIATFKDDDICIEFRKAGDEHED